MVSDFKQSEGFMTTWDQTKLYYRAWIPPIPTDKAVILFHRGHEHSGRFNEFVHQLDLKEFAFFAWDARWNGNTPGPRDYADNFSVYVKDANTFVNFISEKYQISVENIVILAHSVGGVIASTRQLRPAFSKARLPSPDRWRSRSRCEGLQDEWEDDSPENPVDPECLIEPTPDAPGERPDRMDSL